MSGFYMQLFLYLNVFLMGALTAVAIRHAYAHFRPHVAEAEKHPVTMQNGHLPPAVREHLLEAAQANFQTVLDRSAKELSQDLEKTSAQINKLLEKHGTDVINDDLQHYRSRLAELQKQTEAGMSKLQAGLSTHQAELDAEFIAHQAEQKAKLAEEIAAEKQRLLQQIDTQLADAVGSFLLDTLQHNVDLGAQATYLTSMLDEHKADFTRGLADEAKTSK